MAILTTKPKDYRTGDTITAKLINDTVETAIEAYRVVAAELLKGAEIDWPKLQNAFSVDGNGDLIFDYDGNDAPTFSLVGGDLILDIPIAE